MCRIAGICSTKTSTDELKLIVKQMCTAMANGGPDDEGFYSVNENTVFGHRRLSLLDLTAAGHQPMLYKNLTITFNGEIYNFLSLKQELLALGYTFTSHTDTEVILAGYTHYGTKIFGMLEGMFAFALHDETTNTTYLVRDEMGIKPLYYLAQKDELVFASEVKAFKYFNQSLTDQQNWRIYLLAFGHIPHPYTTIDQVFALPGGHCLKWDHQLSTYEITDYTSNQPKKAINNLNQASDLLATVMQKAVKEHLIADAPIGVFLSGGLDSSIITLLANKFAGENLKTVSINFNEDEFSEAKYQQIVTAKTKGTHQSYTITEEDFKANFDHILNAMDQPSNDAINSWFVNKCAKENGLKAVLSGIGADELFGGYPSFKRIKLIKFIRLLPKFIIRLTGKLPSERLRRIYYLSYTNPIGEYLFLRGFFAPQSVAKIVGISKKEINTLLEQFPLPSELNQLTDGERISWFETNLFMKNQLLKDTDYMSMNHGIEVRLPFLDHNLLTLASEIKSELKFNHTRPKGLLIKSFENILPIEIYDRPKMGFTFPLQQWLRKHDKVTDLSLYASNNYSFNLMKKFKKGNLHWSKAFALYQVFKT